MKKYYTLFLVVLMTLPLLSQNLGFEEWNIKTMNTLDDYKSTINELLVGELSVIRSTDAKSGKYSLRMETVDYNGNKLFGFFFNGDPEENDGGSKLNIITGVDSIIGFYKYNLIKKDTALIMCITKKDGSTSGGGIMKITGNQPTWKRFSIPIGSSSADTVLIGGASSNAMTQEGIEVGSFLMLDSVQLKQGNVIENIPNFSFENWSSMDFEYPKDWNNEIVRFAQGGESPIQKVTDSYKGTYACLLKTVLVEKDTVVGLIMKGNWAHGGLHETFGGMPYNKNVEKVRFHYKYFPQNEDNAFVEFRFSKNGRVIGRTGSDLSVEKNKYVLWEQDVHLAELPDTVFVGIFGGSNPGTQLFVDAIEFVVNSLSIDDVTINQIVPFPVPSFDKLNFEIKGFKPLNVMIFDMSGKLLKNEHFNKTGERDIINIDVSDLERGDYIYRILIDQKVVSGKFSKK